MSKKFFSNNDSPIQCGYQHSYVLDYSTGKGYAFGEFANGRLGIGYPIGKKKMPNIFKPELIKMPNNLKIKQLSCCGGYHALLIDQNDISYAFGYGSNGQTGQGQVVNFANYSVFIPTTPKGLENIRMKQVCAGFNFSFFVGLDGRKLFFCGNCSYFDTGGGNRNSNSNVFTPKNVYSYWFKNNERIKEIQCGAYHSMIQMVNGDIFCVGNENYGNFGKKLDNKFKRPVKLTWGPKVEIIQIQLGWHHSMFLGIDGNVYACGDNSNGQLSVTSNRNSVNNFQLVKFFKDKHVLGICARNHLSMIHTIEGTYVSGWNEANSVHNLHRKENTTQIQFSEAFPEIKSQVLGFGGGYGHNLYVFENGIVAAKGNNFQCQCGTEKKNMKKKIGFYNVIKGIPKIKYFSKVLNVTQKKLYDCSINGIYNDIFIFVK